MGGVGGGSYSKVVAYSKVVVVASSGKMQRLWTIDKSDGGTRLISSSALSTFFFPVLHQIIRMIEREVHFWTQVITPKSVPISSDGTRRFPIIICRRPITTEGVTSYANNDGDTHKQGH
jgi:hypothetical protein